MVTFRDWLPMWWRLTPRTLSAALTVTSKAGYGSVQKWLDQNPELFIDPRSTVDWSAIGVNGRWEDGFELFRAHDLRYHTEGVCCRIYIFQHHIDDLLEKTQSL